MRLRFAKLNPTGNTTTFILDPVPVPEQARITPLQASPSCARQSSVAVVSLPGITHVVVDAHEWAPREDVLFQLTSALGLERDPCVGIMFCYGGDGRRGHEGGDGQDQDGEDKRDHEAQGEDACERVVPLVHVRATGTTVWESSCASGAVAVALARSVATSRPGRFASRQPGGVLYVTVELAHRPWAGEAPMVRLEGEVKMVAEGEVFL